MRFGSFSNSLEEYAEALLLLNWVENKSILNINELEIVNYDEYVGALSDFTGEVGRLAVSLASSRDINSVKHILEADYAVSYFVSRVNLFGKYTKKFDAISTNTKKIEEIVFDLCMSVKGKRSISDKIDEPKFDVDSQDE